MFEKSTNFKNDRKWSRQSKRRKRSDSSHFLESSSGFHPLSQIEFLSSFNFSDPFDPQLQPANSNSEDPTPIVPVTEMSDLELKRLGFPVPATTTESIYSMLHGFSGPGSHDLSSVIDSPYIKFTSRKLNFKKKLWHKPKKKHSVSSIDFLQRGGGGSEGVAGG